MREHFSTVEEARRVVKDFLRSWEIKTALELGRGEMEFQFEDSHVIDRNPPPPGSSEFVHVSASGGVKHTGEAISILCITRSKYPDPPTVFTVTPDVKTLWHRYNNYLDGNEPLPSMANFCLTLVENKADGKGKKEKREFAANLFKIDKPILNMLGNLTANRGDPMTARKVPDKGRSMTALSEKEKKWIEAVVKIFIQRMGELANIQTAKLITMTDLPKI
jgi:hypothetical protein